MIPVFDSLERLYVRQIVAKEHTIRFAAKEAHELLRRKMSGHVIDVNFDVFTLHENLFLILIDLIGGFEYFCIGEGFSMQEALS